MYLMKKSLLILPALLLTALCTCQNANNKAECTAFDEPELSVPAASGEQWEALESGVHLGWGSSNARYHKNAVPDLEDSDQIELTAWKNERVYAQLTVWSKDPVNCLSVSVTGLQSGNSRIAPDFIDHFYVRNVITDSYLNGCGKRENTPETARLLPDCLEDAEACSLRAGTTRGIWFNIYIPRLAEPGNYSGEVIVSAAGEEIKRLTLRVRVCDRVLPDPEEWAFHLDLWQNPYAVARYHNVELWSDAHFKLMTPLYSLLAEAGQKCITASILHKPWGGQTYDPFGTMIKHILKENGRWEFDYQVFDQWVAFMMRLGIREQINCYSLIPWGNQLGYFDEKSGQDTLITAAASSKEFAAYWIPFLTDFKKHLKEQGLYQITTIAMDERPMEDMLNAVRLIDEYSGLKITSAANYDPGLSGRTYDLSVAFAHPLEESVIHERRSQGQFTTFYVCCADESPNNFTYSPPAEGVWQGWFAFAQNLDGFLRWAYNSWVEDPLHDSRFRTWPAGDTYFVYPGARSSIRFEKLREGIQDYEKLRMITRELKASDTDEARNQLKALQNVLDEFDLTALETSDAELMVLRGKALLNDL